MRGVRNADHRAGAGAEAAIPRWSASRAAPALARALLARSVAGSTRSRLRGLVCACVRQEYRQRNRRGFDSLLVGFDPRGWRPRRTRMPFK